MLKSSESTFSRCQSFCLPVPGPSKLLDLISFSYKKHDSDCFNNGELYYAALILELKENIQFNCHSTPANSSTLFLFCIEGCGSLHELQRSTTMVGDFFTTINYAIPTDSLYETAARRENKYTAMKLNLNYATTHVETRHVGNGDLDRPTFFLSKMENCISGRKITARG